MTVPAETALAFVGPSLAINDPGDIVLLARYGKRWRWYPSPESRRTGHRTWAVPEVAQWYWADSPEDARAACEVILLDGKAPIWGGKGRSRPRDRKGRILAAGPV
jgi:hypothetical protein